ILQDEKRVGVLFGDRGKSSRKVLRSLHLVGLKRYSQRTRRALRLFQGKYDCGVTGIPERRRARQSWHRSFKDFQAFCAYFGGQLRTSRKIPTGMRKADNQTGVQWINSVRVHDGNGLGRVLDGKSRGRRDHDDYVDIQSNHLRGKFLEALSLASCIPALNDEVAALLVPVFTKALEQRVIKTLMSVGDKSHPPNFSCLLRARRERPRRGAAEQRDECAARFHSITSSARASTVGGISRPSVFAVVRLMTRSTHCHEPVHPRRPGILSATIAVEHEGRRDAKQSR